MKHILLPLILFYSTSLQANINTTSLANYGELRDERKIGVGGQLLGASGNAGILLEMNFHPSWGVNLGYGAAPDFQSFLIEYKQILYGERLTTYGILGFTRWFGQSKSSITSTNPGFVANKLMSSEDRKSGTISENLIYPGIGIQYFKFSGEWTGLSLFGQIIVLADLEDFIFVPTVGLGSVYYF